MASCKSFLEQVGMGKASITLPRVLEVQSSFRRSNLQEPQPLSTLGELTLVPGLPHRLPSAEHGQEAAAAFPGVTAGKGRVEGAGEQSC